MFSLNIETSIFIYHDCVRVKTPILWRHFLRDLYSMKTVIIVAISLISYFCNAQTDGYAEALRLNQDKQYLKSAAVCTSNLEKLAAGDTLIIKFLELSGEDYIALNEFATAANDFKKLITLKPGIAGYVNLSYCYGEIGDYDNCIDILKKALLIDNKDISIYNNLSYYSARQNNYADAISFANQGLMYVADQLWKGTLLNNRGYGYIGLKQYDKALNDINESIKLNDDNSFAYCYRALANIGLKKMETVCDDLNKAKDMGAQNLTADLIRDYCRK